jgi:hypothetical protein
MRKFIGNLLLHLAWAMTGTPCGCDTSPHFNGLAAWTGSWKINNTWTETERRPLTWIAADFLMATHNRHFDDVT